jgi:hypothetical protein
MRLALLWESTFKRTTWVVLMFLGVFRATLLLKMLKDKVLLTSVAIMDRQRILMETKRSREKTMDKCSLN